MRQLFRRSTERILLGVLVLGLLGGCSGKKISTGVGDQSTIPGPKVEAPPAPVVEIAPEPPPAVVEAPPPAVIEAPPPAVVEAPPPPAPVEPPSMEAPKPVEEARVMEPPAAPPPAPAPAPESEPLPQIAQAPVAQPIEPPPAVEPSGSLQDVYFDFDQSAIRSDARTTLEDNAKLLRNSSLGKILIEGHCDERGTSAYNLILGEQRAKSVKRYLENLGISASQLQIVSYGKERPFCKDHTDPCWQSNRRAHFVIK